MKVGFTGTRNGMTVFQKRALARLFKRLGVDELHHGDCIGSDEEACALAKALDILTVAHPPDNNRLRAFVKSDIVLTPLPYLRRNHAVVDDSEVLIATPFTEHEVLRSGTWATIRYGLRSGKPVYVIRPDGTTERGRTV